MKKKQTVLDFLKTRRSVPKAFLQDPAPAPEELEELLEIASRVPDHGKLARWRFVIYQGDARLEIGARLAEIAQQINPKAEPAQLDMERTQFLPAPLTVGVISTAAPHPKIPEFEQLMSAGNAAFNLVYAALAMGYGAHWVTRWFAYDDEAARYLGARKGERFVGFVHIGTPSAQIEDRDRPDLSKMVEYWKA